MMCKYDNGLKGLSGLRFNIFVISTEGRNLLIQRTTAFQEISPFGRNDGYCYEL